MKHAYLIIAHNEFEHLQRLISALDDERNDIYVHIDRKVRNMPEISCRVSTLTILQNRIDVRWGHISQIKAEYALLRTAYDSKINYDYYHIISGTHYPLTTLPEIDNYFSDKKGMTVFAPVPWSLDEIKDKFGRYHFFSDSVNRNNFKEFLWRLCLRVQGKYHIRNYSWFYEKCSQWVSISKKDISIILNFEKHIKKLMNHTLCPDEVFIPTILHSCGILYIIDKKLLFTNFLGASPKELDLSDYSLMIESNAIFARKFSSSHSTLTDKIAEHVTTKNNNHNPSI